MSTAVTRIQLKYSTGTATPTALNIAEPAYSYTSNTFFIGSPDGNGAIAIGGKFYIDQQQSIFNTANAAFAAANTGAGQMGAYNHANAAFESGNTAATLQSAINSTQNNSITAAFYHANAAFTAANNATDTYVRNHANAAFARANNSVDANNGGTITGDVIINANLFVNGTTTFVNTVNQLIGDNIITLNADLPQGGTPTQDAGFEVERGVQPNSSILWIESAGKWSANNGNSSYYLANEAVAAGAYNHANAAFTAANNATDTYVRNHANAAFDTANSAVAVNLTQNNSITSAFIHANAAFIAANTGSSAVAAFNQANSAFFHANSSFFHANAAFSTANSAAIAASSAQGTADAAAAAASTAQGTADGAVAVNVTQNTNITTANNTAVAAFKHANAAFAQANTYATASAAVFNGTGDGSTKSFNLGYAPVSDGSASVVSIDGIVQYEGTYTITPANSSINFVDAVGAGERIRVLAYTSVNPYVLGTTGVTAGDYGNANTVATFRTAANGQLTFASNVSIAIGASQITSGTLDVQRGGTGAGTFTTNGVLLGQGTSAFQTASSSTEGHVLTINASGVPTFAMVSGGTF